MSGYQPPPGFGGAPAQQPQYGAQYGAPPGQQPQYGGAQPQYGAPPPQQPQYGGYGQQQPPPPQQGYPAPPAGQYPPPQGQYGAPPPSGYYPPQDPLFQHFQEVAGADQRISAEELQECLSRTGLGSYPRPDFKFEMETCRAMIAMLDAKKDMSLDFNEFKTLYQALEAWKQNFQAHDTDRSGSIEHGELAAVIKEMGFNMSPAAVEVCVRRYSAKSNGQIEFDDFVTCAVRIRALSSEFRARDQQGQGFATLRYDDFMQMVMRV